MVKTQGSIMLCSNGDCVDVTRVKCEDRFDNVDEIIECEELQKMVV
jgi:hypothetical protein